MIWDSWQIYSKERTPPHLKSTHPGNIIEIIMIRKVTAKRDEDARRANVCLYFGLSCSGSGLKFDIDLGSSSATPCIHKFCVNICI